MQASIALQSALYVSDIPFRPDWDVTSTFAVPTFPVMPPPDERIPVIIAEDDPVSRKLVAATIEKGGFHTIVTNDGNEAMTVLRARTRPSVAVLDWMMPGMDGREMCRRIREVGRNVHIIMLTARGTTEDIVGAINDGADDYMVKPFDREELLARVRAGARQLNAQAGHHIRVEEAEGSLKTRKMLKFEIPL